QRISLNKDRERNRLDLEAFHFHERVHDAYQMLLQQFPERIKWIDADQPPDDVARTAFDCILTHILSKEGSKGGIFSDADYSRRSGEGCQSVRICYVMSMIAYEEH